MRYAINWNDEHSLHNWTTELNLICEPPLTIGIMGTLAFISIGLGALLFGSLSDKFGRWKCILFATAVTPFSQAILLGWIPGCGLSLISIYSATILIGLSYSLRGSASYVYTTETLFD